MYTVVDCGILVPPSSGDVMINRTSFGGVAEYTCIPGYQLLGNNSRVCQVNGEWSDDEPSCERKLLKIRLFRNWIVLLVLTIFCSCRKHYLFKM